MHSYEICRIILLDIVDLNTSKPFPYLLHVLFTQVRRHINNCNGRISRKEKDKSIVHIPFRDK